MSTPAVSGTPTRVAPTPVRASQDDFRGHCPARDHSHDRHHHLEHAVGMFGFGKAGRVADVDVRAVVVTDHEAEPTLEVGEEVVEVATVGAMAVVGMSYRVFLCGGGDRVAITVYLVRRGRMRTTPLSNPLHLL